MNMAEGAPPHKRPKTDDAFNLEDSLPDELTGLPVNNGFPLGTNQPSQMAASSVISPPSVPNGPHPSNHKKLTQLLQSGHNSPKHGQTSSPNSNNSPRPQQQHTPVPQPSPLSMGQNSLQSPNAGSMAAVRNNMKSPPSSLARPSSRPGSAISATPSPRPVSVRGGNMSVAGMSNSPMAVNNPMRNSMVSSQFQGSINHNMGMSSMAPSMSPNQDNKMMTNGINRLGPSSMGNDMGMQMGSGQMMNPQGNFVNQQRMPSQIGPMHTIGSSMNNFGQLPVGTIPGPTPRQMQLNAGNFNDSSLSRPPSGMVTQDMSRQNHLGNGMGMNGPMMMGDKPGNNLQQMMGQPNSMNMLRGMDKPNMQMTAMRPGMPSMTQPGNMQHLQTSQVQDVTACMMPQDTGQQLMPLQMGSNHPGTNPMQQTRGGQDQSMSLPARIQPGPVAAGSQADPEKRRLIQQQLVLLLHAYKCSKKENNGDPSNCPLPHCRTMKEVLRHMNGCTQGKSCQVAHCASSRQIIAHWRACNRHDCVVCLPLKSVPSNNVGAAPNNAMQSRWQTPVSQMGDSSMGISTVANHAGAAGPPYPGNYADPLIDPNLHQNASNSSQSLLPNGLSITSMSGMVNSVGPNPDGSGSFFAAPRVEREWHKDVKEELRNHLVQKLVQAIFPTPQKVSLTDERMRKLVTFARKVEGDMYDQANSRSEYYHLLAEKIYKIQKELEEKRASRKRTISVGQRMTPVMQGPGGMRMGMHFNQPMPSASTAQSMVMDNMLANAPIGQNSGGSFQAGGLITQFQKASDEIRQQSDASPLTGGQNTGLGNTQHFTTQSNLMQENNSMVYSNSLVAPDGRMRSVYGQPSGDVKPVMMPGSVGNMSSHRPPPSNKQMNQVSEMSSSSFNTIPRTQSAQPRLEKLLLETNSTLATTTSGMQSSNFFASTSQSSATQPPQRAPFGPDQSHSQHPASLQEILQGSGAASSTMATSSFVSLSATSSSNVLTSPPPFVSTHQAGSKPKNGNVIGGAGASGGFPRNTGNIVKTEPGLESESAVTVKTEMQNDSYGNRGKPWSQSQSSGKGMEAERKTDSDAQFNNASPAVSSSTPSTSNHDPFVKQENMSESVLPKTKASHKVFDPLELKVALLPMVDKLYRQEPEAVPFRQPVDPDKLNIPDYFDIVKEPMDLASIRRNLEIGKYKEPWEFIADVWLMFNNAWLYNRRTTRVYKYCLKLKEIFEVEIDPVMQRLGYCCGRKLEFKPMTLCCYGKQLCTIPTGAVYFDYQNRYDYCEKCFTEIPGDAISLADDPSKPQTSVTTIPKSQFEKKKNDVLDPEPFEICNSCGRKMHKICVLHMSPIWPEGFTCDGCLSKRGTQRKANRYPAMKLPQNKLSEHIENRVNSYIKCNDTTGDAGHVRIRVVYSGDKTVEVRSGMKTKFVDTKEMPETFPYRAKAFFAFEEIDGVDVCFFGVHVQEYGSDAPRPNQRRVYLSYLDSVHFFRPRHLRTAVYHEILIGYFEYCKNLGYEFAHIWACPPCEGDDYIFHCHPLEQKIPKPKRLQDWYKKMLDKAISEQIIVDYKDIFHQAKEDRLQYARELPYFEGDFWPNVLEEGIKEIEQEEEERRLAEANEQAAAEESDQGSSSSVLKNGTNNKKSKKANIKKTINRTAKKKVPLVMNDLSDKLYQTMEKHKEVFFVIRLNTAETLSKIGPTVEPDPPLQCDLMDGRDAFLTLAREKHYEFSSLRRAKWSTMAMLIELHTNGQDKFSYMCDNCRNNVETRYTCTVCHDYDLCINCYPRVNHEHKMDKVGLGLDDGTGSQGAGNAKSSTIPVERCMQSLVHACQCKNANCNMPACFKMKKVVHHAKNCKKKSSGTCLICKQLIALCYYHAKNCQEKKCAVAFCHNIKIKLKEQERQHRLRQAHMMQRRMKVMVQNTNAAQSGPHTPAVVANASAQKQSSPKIDGRMRKPQPSPLSTSQDVPQPMQTGQGMMVPSQPVAEKNINTNMMNRSPLGTASPHMNAVQVHMASTVTGINQPQPMQPTGQTYQQPASFAVARYQSPPPEGAVRAAQQAQKVANQQARERERQNAFTSSPNPNVLGNRPMNTIQTHMIGANQGTAWGMGNVMRPQVRQQIMPGQQPAVLGGSPQTVNTGQLQNQNTQALRQVLDILKQDSQSGPGPRNTRPRSNEQLMALLKNNPQLMNTIIKQRKAQVQNKQQQQPMQQKQFMSPNNMPTSTLSSMQQQQQTMVGVQQGALQNTMNQSGMSMQPVQVSTIPQMQWQQQQHIVQPQHQQNQFQTPAPPYRQAISQQQRVMNARFQQQQRMHAQIRPQMSPQMVMPRGMNPQMSNMQQGLQSPIPHHPGMVASKGVPTARPSSQPMPVGRPGMQQMQPHPMAGRTTPLGQNQGSVPQHMVQNMEQSYNVASSQSAMMGGGFSHATGQVTGFNAAGGVFPSNVNQSLGHLNNPNQNLGNLDGYVKINDP